MPLKQRQCPKDWTRLVEEKISVSGLDVTADRCPKCSGLFLDKGEIKRITGNHNLNDLLTKHLGLDSDSQRVCPSCGSVMDAEDAAGVEVDVCLQCKGVWLDAGELEAVKAKGEEAFARATFSVEKEQELDRAERAERRNRRAKWKAFLRGLAFR